MNKDIEKLKKNKVKKFVKYTKKQVEFLREMKYNDISISDLFRDSEMMERLFPGRSRSALKSKFYTL